MAEYGRAVRFAWSENMVKALGDDASITICEFTNSKKAYVMRLGHLRNALRVIDGKRPVGDLRNLPDIEDLLKKRR